MMNNIAINDLINILLIVIILIGMIVIGYLVFRIVFLLKIRFNTEKPNVRNDIALDVCANMKDASMKDDSMSDKDSNYKTMYTGEYDDGCTVMLGMNTGSECASARLIFLGDDGKPAGRVEFLVKKTTVLGRGEDVDIKIFDRTVSKRHAEIVYAEDQFWMEDLGSSNGTYLNGERVVSKSPILDGGIVKIGSTSFSVQIS